MEPRIDNIIRYIKELYEKRKIYQIFFTYSNYDHPKLLIEIDGVKIYLENFWKYIDVIGLVEGEKEILRRAFGIGIRNEINLNNGEIIWKQYKKN